jgi:alkanesulfonate monooxygenase SsuD/methylene tetrahydromethanopterin reductase-like flavin-dependent oxidoreductase (luciferase family)
MTSTATRPLRVGLFLPSWTALPRGVPHRWATELPAELPRWTDLLSLARQAEAAGLDALWLPDHLLIRWAAIEAQYGDPVPPALAAAAPVGVWECWSLLAALAAATARIALGPFVSCTNFRNPALLAKIATTVDEIAGGRLILGLGAGDFEDEHDAFGLRWDRRVSRFAEALQIVHPLLRRGRVDFAGEFYQARDCELRPRGPRPQGPPILIGALAHGPRMLDLVARYADVWNGWVAGQRSHPDIVPPLREAVDAACRAVGRDPATLGRTLTVGVAFGGRTIWGAEPVTASADQVAEAFRAFAREGIDHLQVFLNPATAEGIEQLAAVLERLDHG